MKRLYLTGFLALALACNVLEPETAVPAGREGGMIEVTAVLADAPVDSRTTLAGDVVQFAWSADDAILAIDGIPGVWQGNGFQGGVPAFAEAPALL